MLDRPAIRVEPGMAWGRPHLRGVSTEAIAGLYAAEGDLDAVAADYGLTRHEMLVVLWFEGMYGGRSGWRHWAEIIAGPVLAGWVDTPVEKLEPPDPAAGGIDMVDVLHADGTHEYWSTHCRHGRHDACRATELAPGVPRRPASCKACDAPCRCDLCDHEAPTPPTE